MKIYTYSKARQKLADVLEESKKEEVLIRRRKGDVFSIVPVTRYKRSPFNIKGLRKKITRDEILEALRESRDRGFSMSIVKKEGEISPDASLKKRRK